MMATGAVFEIDDKCGEGRYFRVKDQHFDEHGRLQSMVATCLNPTETDGASVDWVFTMQEPELIKFLLAH